MKSSVQSYLFVFSGLLCIYFATARLGLNIMPVNGIAALAWPPSGIALAAIFLFGYRYWPAVALGEFLANAFFGMPVAAACVMAIGNSLEAITGVFLLRNVVGFRADLATMKSVIGLILCAAFASTAISATSGVTILLLTHKISTSVYWYTWSAWWIGDALGDLIVASLIFVWSSRRWKVLKPSKVLELIIVSILAIGAAFLIFTKATTSPELYLLFCFIIWSALRFSPQETVSLIFVMSVIAITGTLYGHGTFSERSVSENLLLLQLFMGVLSSTGMLLCAAVAERRDAEEKFKLVFSSSPIAMILTDIAGKLLIANSQTEKLFGFQRDELIGLQVEKLMPFCLKDQMLNCKLDFFKSSQTQLNGIELCGVRKDNVELQLQVSLTPINTPEGTQLLSSIIDITERKRNEDGLRYLSETGIVLSKSLDYPETLKKTAQLPLPLLADWCIVDIVNGGIKQVAIAYPDLNRETITEELSNRVPPDPSFGRGTAYVIQSGKSEMYTDLTSDTDAIARTLGLVDPQLLKELGAVSYICVPLITRGRILGAITYVNRVYKSRYDLFYLSLAEEIANRAAIAIDNAQLYLDSQKAIHMRDYFLSVVSHDLKNPLFAISAGTSLLMDPQLPMERAMVQNIAEQMSKSTVRMDKLIHDLLDLAKLEENQLRIDQRRYDSAILLDEAISQIKIQLEKKQINLVKNFSRVNCFVFCDHERVLQILVNLLDNAIKFTPDGGSITISTKRSGDAIEFSISDTGSGISQEQLPHVFDRYWKADRASRRGAGLGLSIVSELVKVHGGKIWVESRLEQGSTFFFTLPAD